MLRANFSFPKAMSYSLAILLEKAMFSMKVRENLHVFVPYLHRFARSCTRWRRDMTKPNAAHTEDVSLLQPDFCGSRLGNLKGLRWNRWQRRNLREKAKTPKPTKNDSALPEAHTSGLQTLLRPRSWDVVGQKAYFGAVTCQLQLQDV